MSVRRRAIQARVKRRSAFKAGMERSTLSLERMKRVVDEAIAAGETRLSTEEFARRFNQRSVEPSRGPTLDHDARIRAAVDARMKHI